MAKMNYNKGKFNERIHRQQKDSKFTHRIKRQSKQSATPAQIAFMEQLGIEVPKKCSKIQASNLISFKLNIKKHT